MIFSWNTIDVSYNDNLEYFVPSFGINQIDQFDLSEGYYTFIDGFSPYSLEGWAIQLILIW